ncbi:MAG TPA: alcohol dehydrogenase catalytic domain-containing protein [Acidimicrobiales bacterium]|nr:alcohol dehydrogenase catalytic domain-containing protein [Acidimicrobiales bacterium]
MRAVQLDFADRSFPASLVEIDEPALPGDDWARVQVMAGGICGSDLHIFRPSGGGGAPTMTGVMPLPVVLGHEIAGVVVEAGPRAGVAVGQRVAVEPTITCEARGIDPMCRFCQRGDIASCQRIYSHVFTPGFALGYTQGMGGGWAEQVVAHRTMLFALPDAVPDHAASLHEPVSIASHGLLRRQPAEGDPIAVVGCGIIGLAAVAAARVLFPANEVTAIARYPHQAKAAEACGAHHVVMGASDSSHFDELAALTGSDIMGTAPHRILVAGFPYVVEAVGSDSSVTESLRIADNRGTVLMLGAATTHTYDLTPVFWKEIELVGAINHSFDPGPRGGPTRHSVARAVDILAAGALPHEVVVTHDFPLEDYRTAVETALDRQSGAIKVVFRPNA